MAPNARSSPEPLIIYPYLHRNSQCSSCSTVMPGDICFNCGRLSTLLVTPRPPKDSSENRFQATASPTTFQDRPVLKSKAFESQYNLVETLLAANIKHLQKHPQPRVYNSQLTEMDKLLDARNSLAYIRTLNDAAPFNDTASSSSYGRLTFSSDTFSKSSTVHATYSSSSLPRTPRSDSLAVSDGLYEDGRPHRKNIAGWLEDITPPGKSSAKLTRRGVDCRLSLHGRVCEWVIFL